MTASRSTGSAARGRPAPGRPVTRRPTPRPAPPTGPRRARRARGAGEGEAPQPRGRAPRTRRPRRLRARARAHRGDRGADRAHGGGQADQQGALTAIAAEPFGFVVLVVSSPGSSRSGRGRALAAPTGFRWASGWARTQRRIGAGATALGVLAWPSSACACSSPARPGRAAAARSRPPRACSRCPRARSSWASSGLIILVVAGATAWAGITARLRRGPRLVPAARAAAPTGAAGWGSPATSCAPSRSR